MKKLPCLFVREFTPRPGGRGQDFQITSAVTPGLEWVLAGEGVATRKWDGTACMVRDRRLFKRYDAKGGRPAPPGGIPCDDPDPKTGHWPHWIPVGEEPQSKWHLAAWTNRRWEIGDGTYELCGPHFQANPQHLDIDTFIRHGTDILDAAPRSFEELRVWLAAYAEYEGIVFWRGGEPRCKIRRADFALPWPASK